ncbi:MAG: TPM domain-containing protein [bacterium]
MPKKILILLVLLLISFSAFAEDKLPGYQGYVNDYAGILSPAQKQELEQISLGLKKSTGAELAVAVVKSVEPLDSKLYAVKLFEKWGIGQKGKDNGLLLLLAMEERRVEIEVGYGLEGDVPDALAGRILDAYAVPLFKEGKFGEGLVNTARALSEIVAGKTVELPEQTSPAPQSAGPLFFYVIIAAVIIGAILRKPGSIMMGIMGAIWGSENGLAGAIVGMLIGCLFGFWGIMFWGRGGAFGGSGGGFGGFGGGRSGGGGGGRGF